MYKKIFLFVLLISVSICSAQEVDESLQKLKSKFEDLKSFSTDFKAEYKMPDGGNNITSGKFFFAPDDKYRLEIKGIIISSDGEVTRTYQKSSNKVIINYTSEYPNSLSLNKYLNEYPELCSLSLVSNENLEGIKFLPKDDDLEFEYAEVYFNRDYIIKKIVIADYQGSVYTAYLSNQKSHQNFANSFFEYNGPEGVKVVDLR